MSVIGRLIRGFFLFLVVPVLFLVGFILLADLQQKHVGEAAGFLGENIMELIRPLRPYIRTVYEIAGIPYDNPEDHLENPGESPGANRIENHTENQRQADNLILDDPKDQISKDQKAFEMANTPPADVRQLPLEASFKAEEVQKSIEQDLDINKVPLEYSNEVMAAEDILSDKLNLIPPDFKIPVGLRERVGFWLDIYTKYSSHFVVIHDSERPWLIYKIVDLREIYDRHINRFAKDILDRRAVSKAKNKTRNLLLSISKTKDFLSLTGEKLRLFRLFDTVPGQKKKVIGLAAHNLRVQRGQKDFFRRGVIYSSQYLIEMEQIFARYDLPVELVRLPLVESSFNVEAQSKVGASGIWQFMRNMGRHYLKMAGFIDERNSPLKSTEAAAKLMLSNFKLLKTWPMAVTAYNHGAGDLTRAVKKYRTRNLADIITKLHSRKFSFASQNFFCEFLAALYGEKYQDDVFGPLAKYPPLAGESIDLEQRIRAKNLVELVGITFEELKLYNPDLKARAIRNYTYLPRGYHVRLPPGRKSRLQLFYQETADIRIHRRLRS